MKIQKAAKKLGLWEKRPSRFYGNERRRWPSAQVGGDRAAERRKRGAGETLGPPHSREGLGAIASAVAVPVPAGQGGVCRYRAPRGSLGAAHPRPFLASPLGTAETSRAQRKHPHGVRVHCIFRVEALYLPGRSVWLPSGGSRGEDCRLPPQHWRLR